MKKEKQLLLDEIKNQIDGAPAFVIAQYSDVSANLANQFRREIAKVGGSFEVVKKRVFIKALESLDLKFDLKALPGHIGLVFAAKDPIEITKTVLRFSQDNESPIKLIGARVEGSFLDAQDIDRLSKLPSKDQMRAELLGLFEAPMAQTLSTMEALLSSVMYCLDNKAKGE